MLENARKTYLDVGEGRGRVHFLIALVQLCAQKQRNKRCDVFLEICLLFTSIGKIHSKEQPRRPFADTRDLDRPPWLDIGYLYCRPFYSAGSGPCARPRDFENRLLSDVLMMCWEPTRRAGIQLVYTKDIVSIVRLQLYVIF